MKWEGSLQGRVDTCQRILTLLTITLGVINYLIIFFLIIIIFTINFLPALPRTQFLLFLLPLVLLCFPLPLGLGVVHHPHGWISQQWS